jgi:hypothetical protein
MVIRIPRLSSDLPGYSLLGLGDIVLPGLLVAFTRMADLRLGLRLPRGYFIPILAGAASTHPPVHASRASSLHHNPRVSVLIIRFYMELEGVRILCCGWVEEGGVYLTESHTLSLFALQDMGQGLCSPTLR